MTEKRIIYWQVIGSGEVGHGHPIPADEAIASAALANDIDAGRIHHWTEPDDVLSAQVPGAGFMGEAS